MNWVCAKTCVLAVALLSMAAASVEAANLTPPYNVAATATSGSSVRITWADSNERLTEFLIFRSVKPDSGFSQVAQVSPTARSWTNSGLTAGTTYYYRLRAKLNGNTSTLSNTVSVTPTNTVSDTTPPPMPTGVRNGTVECGRIDVFWTAVTASDLRGYNVYRNGSFFRQVLAPSISFTDLTVTGGSSYTYGVASYDAAGNQSAQAFVTVNTPTCATAPTPTRTATRTATPLQTSTPVRTATRTATPLQTSTPVRTATRTATPLQTSTPIRTTTRTSTPVPTATPAVDDGSPWAKRFGGAGADIGESLAVDGNGDVAMTGAFTGSADFGGGSLGSAGGEDVVLAKYSSSGAHVWSKRIGSIGDDRAYGVAVDQSANCDGAGGTNCIVIVGVFTYTVDFDPGLGTANHTSAGAGDLFLAKYSSTGTYLWAQRFGSPNANYKDYGYAVAVDARTNCDGNGGAGCVVFTGTFLDAMDVGGQALTGPAGVMSIFAAKLGPTGARVWARTYANTSASMGLAVAVNADGDVALTGGFKGSVNFGSGTRSSWGNDDIFVAKLRGSDGGAVWANRYGSDGLDRGYGVAFDGAGNVLVTGSFGLMSGGVGFGGTTWMANGTDMFVVQLNASGGHVWSRRCTGTFTNTRQSTGVTADAAGNVVITGHFYGTVNCGTDTQSLTGVGYSDVLVAKFAANGGALWMERFGSAGGSNMGAAIATDQTTDEIVYTGAFQGRVDVEGQSLSSAGLDDIFLVRTVP